MFFVGNLNDNYFYISFNQFFLILPQYQLNKDISKFLE